LINITDKSSDKGAEVTCTVPTNGLSPAIFCYAKGNTLNFIFSTDRTPAATVRIPPKGNAFILVFVAAAKAANTLPWRVLVIEDTPKNFPDGGAFVANFHNQDIRFLIGTPLERTTHEAHPHHPHRPVAGTDLSGFRGSGMR